MSQYMASMAMMKEEKLQESREKLARMESGNRSAEESPHSLQLELGQRTKMEAEVRIMEMAKNKKVERLWQVLQEMDKKLEKDMKRLEERVARIESSGASEGKKILEDNLEDRKLGEKVMMM